MRLWARECGNSCDVVSQCQSCDKVVERRIRCGKETGIPDGLQGFFSNLFKHFFEKIVKNRDIHIEVKFYCESNGSTLNLWKWFINHSKAYFWVRIRSMKFGVSFHQISPTNGPIYRRTGIDTPHRNYSHTYMPRNASNCTTYTAFEHRAHSEIMGWRTQHCTKICLSAPGLIDNVVFDVIVWSIIFRWHRFFQFNQFSCHRFLVIKIIKISDARLIDLFCFSSHHICFLNSKLLVHNIWYKCIYK